ncbi:MAG: aldo/keto reductase, partial [Hyphomicrobiales bacterium]
MKQRRLGRNGPQVGEVGFGAMSFGGFFGPTDMGTSHRTLDQALELGVTHLDTAMIYGPHTSEEFIGAYFGKNPAAKKRFVIATKGGIAINPRGFDNSPAFLRDCLEGSLRRLGVDHVALYYVHRRDHSLPIEEVTGVLA